MARKPAVTRTMYTTHAKVLCLNVETQETEVKEVVLAREYKDDNAIITAASIQIGTDKLKVAHVISSEVKEELYSMSEQTFLEHATRLPNRSGYIKHPRKKNTK